MYVNINGYLHPAKVVDRGFTVPKIFKTKLDETIFYEVGIEEIKDDKIQFLGSFREHQRKEKSSYNLHIHRLAGKWKRLEIKVKDKCFYYSNHKNKIEIGRIVFKHLDVKLGEVYQFEVSEGNKRKNNLHLFKEMKEPSWELTGRNVIPISELCENFNQKVVVDDKLTISYDYMYGNSKAMVINRDIKLDQDLFRAMGLYQAEGNKTKQNYISFVNSEAELLSYFKRVIEEKIGIESNLWRLNVRGNKARKEAAIAFWMEKLGISTDKIYFTIFKTSKPYGIADLRIANNTIRKIFYQLLKLIKNKCSRDKKSCGYFIAGLIAGDGCIVTENNRVKRIEIYFNPLKIDDEPLFYLKCLKMLNINHFYITISYPPQRLLRAQKISKTLKKEHKNITLIKKNKSMGLGGAIGIHKKDDISALSSYNPFYPHPKKHIKFQRCWKW